MYYNFPNKSWNQLFPIISHCAELHGSIWWPNLNYLDVCDSTLLYQYNTSTDISHVVCILFDKSVYLLQGKPTLHNAFLRFSLELVRRQYYPSLSAALCLSLFTNLQDASCTLRHLHWYVLDHVVLFHEIRPNIAKPNFVFFDIYQINWYTEPET